MVEISGMQALLYCLANAYRITHAIIVDKHRPLCLKLWFQFSQDLFSTLGQCVVLPG